MLFRSYGGKYNNNNRKNPYKKKKTRTASSYVGVQEMCISPAQREACVQKTPVNAADSSESVGIKVLTVGGSVWEL